MAKDFDIKHVRLGTLKTLDNGGKIVYINYKGKPLILQTPKLKSPFGLSNWEGKYSIDMSLAGYDGTNENVTSFYKALSAIDDLLMEEGMQNGMAWFKRKISSKDVVDALYTRNVKFSKDKATGEFTDKYPPTFKVAIPRRDDAFQCDVYDASRNKIDLNNVEVKGAKVTVLAQCLGVWLAGGKFGCSWKVIQLRVEPQESIHGYAFRDIGDDVNVASDSDIDAPDASAPKPPTTNIETSDDDDDVHVTEVNDDNDSNEVDATKDGDGGVPDDDELEHIAGSTPAVAASGSGAARTSRGRKAASATAAKA